MTKRRLAAVVTVIAIGWLAPVAASGQREARSGSETAAKWTPPRTPDGRPDLQGLYTTQTFTPLERPVYLAGKEFFTEEEAAALHKQFTAEGIDPLARSAINLASAEERETRLYQTNRDDGTYVHYDNELWLRTTVPKGLSSRRTSLITDPPDGQVPSLTPEATRLVAAAREARRQRGAFDGYETRPLSERCYFWPHNGPPMLPTAYNDIHQIFQTPGYVVLFTEMNNGLPRIIPLDGRPFISDKIRQIPGDSRGHWEGDTLVVESQNFTDKTRFQGSSEHLHVVERFTRVAADRILYEFTVDDPTSWTSPWSAEIPMVKTDGPMFEYACHEGNYDVRHLLEIYRNLEIQAAADISQTDSK